MILAVDFGLKNIGLALADGPLAEPLTQFKYHTLNQALKKIAFFCAQNQVKKIVVGLPQGPLHSRVQTFGRQLSRLLELPVVFQDETLTSQTAARLLRHKTLKKKKKLSHAAAAALILQSYLDGQPSHLLK